MNEIYGFSDLSGFLKLRILKEITSKLNNNQFQYLSNNYGDIGYIMKTLKVGYSKINSSNENNNIELENMFENMIDNLNNFSYYIDKKIDSKCINNILKILKNEELKEINDSSFRLAKYNEYIELLNKQLKKYLKRSIFDFSIISFTVIEREDYEAFQNEREECPNRKEKILFYTINNIPNSNSLNDLFNLESNKDLYFTNSLDYCWLYSNSEEINTNINKIPKINESFDLIACYIYYKDNGLKKEINNSNQPNKNEIYLTYIGAEMETLDKPIANIFCEKEYKVGGLNQICPLFSFRLKRNEFCIIWRDNNFSSSPVYYNKSDKEFKNFLKEMKSQSGKYNLYPCESTEEALRLVKRKKYNKIILLSNVGENNQGADFIEKARDIIGNNVIALFVAKKDNHLDWIENFKNALFSNEPEFTKEYLKIFNYDCYEYERINMIQNFVNKLGNHYNINFNFDEKFLDFPNFKKMGKYSDLKFDP